MGYYSLCSFGAPSHISLEIIVRLEYLVFSLNLVGQYLISHSIFVLLLMKDSFSLLTYFFQVVDVPDKGASKNPQGDSIQVELNCNLVLFSLVFVRNQPAI